MLHPPTRKSGDGNKNRAAEAVKRKMSSLSPRRLGLRAATELPTQVVNDARTTIVPHEYGEIQIRTYRKTDDIRAQLTVSCGVNVYFFASESDAYRLRRDTDLDETSAGAFVRRPPSGRPALPVSRFSDFASDFVNTITRV